MENELQQYGDITFFGEVDNGFIIVMENWTSDMDTFQNISQSLLNIYSTIVAMTLINGTIKCHFAND
jgi:hypothetical protein